MMTMRCFFYDIIRERDGIVANLDYQSDAGHTAYFRAFTNEYTDTEYRGKWEVRDGMEDNVPTINGNIYTYADSKADSEARYRVETRQINSYQLGGEFMLSPSTFIEAQYFTSNALQDDTNKYALIFRSDDAYDTLITINYATSDEHESEEHTGSMVPVFGFQIELPAMMRQSDVFPILKEIIMRRP